MKKNFLLLTIVLLCAVAQGAWAQTEVKTEEALRAVIDATGSYKSVKMTADIPLSSRLVIENGKNVTLDLNGHKLSRSLSSAADDGNVIRVESGGQLTVKDGSGNNSGQITGGKAVNGGGICNHGTLTIEGGTITDCYASSNGGGIYNAPATADGYPTTLTLKGGRITGNTCGDRGGGIFNYPLCVLNIEGAVYAFGNTKGSEANNVYLDGETVFTVTGALTGSTIGVSIAQSCRTITKGYKTHNPTTDCTAIFSSDNSQYGIVQNDDEIALGTIVTFNVRSWDEEHKQVVTTQVTKACTPIEGKHPDDTIELPDGYYVAKSDAEYEIINITGSTVHLVLADGVGLRCAHVKLEEGHTLHVYSQSDGDGQGRLDALNWTMTSTASLENYTENIISQAACIGSGNDQYMGSLFVHGGNIHAHGADNSNKTKHTYYSGAGIGGGKYKGIGANSKVVIYGGRVYAVGSYCGAGIGSGYNCNQGGPIIIYGGDVEATGGKYGAGIGGGSMANGGQVYIYGGRVRAKGGYLSSGGSGAGIGGGSSGEGGQVYIYGGETYANGGRYAAGVGGSESGRGNTLEVHGGYLSAFGFSAPAIGGGAYSHGDAVLITGGTVFAVTGYSHAIIGGGFGKYSEKPEDDGALTINPGLKVSWGNEADAISNAEHRTGEYLHLVEDAAQREVACQNRSYTCVQIEPCNHQGTGSTYTYTDDNYHAATCKACGYTAQEAHAYDGENPCACGKPHDASADLWSMTLHRASAAGSSSYADRVVMMVVKGQTFTIPAVNATEGLTLMGYTTSWTEGDGIEMKDSETLTAVGTVVTPTDNMDLYPRYRYRYVPTWTWDDATATATLTITCSALSSEAVNVSNITYSTDEDNVVKTATGTYDHNGATYTFTDTYILPVESLTLQDAASNEETLESYLDRKVNTLTLSGRTLYKDGGWNTLCLPFSLSADQLDDTDCPLKGATIKTLDSSSFADGTLTLNFTDATTIEAGKPYIVKWTSGNDIEGPLFTSVTINNTLTNVTTDYVNFCGSFSPVCLTGGDKSVLYLGADNKLYYPSTGMTVGSCRGYFQLLGLTAGEPSAPQQAPARAFVLNFGDGEPSAISTLRADTAPAADGIYTLDGRRLSGMPTAKGIYIVNGKKIIIK